MAKTLSQEKIDALLTEGKEGRKQHARQTFEMDLNEPDKDEGLVIKPVAFTSFSELEQERGKEMAEPTTEQRVENLETAFDALRGDRDFFVQEFSAHETQLKALAETSERHGTWLDALNQRVDEASRAAQDTAAKVEAVDQKAAEAWSAAGRADREVGEAKNVADVAYEARSLAEELKTDVNKIGNLADDALDAAERAAKGGRWFARFAVIGLLVATLAIAITLVVPGPQGPEGPEGPAGFTGADGTSVSTQQLLVALHSALAEDTPLRSDVMELLKEVTAKQQRQVSRPSSVRTPRRVSRRVSVRRPPPKTNQTQP